MKNKPIVLFKPKFRVNEVLNKLKPILKLGWTGIGYKTTEFEKEWSKYTGLKNSLFLNSATAGLDLAVQVFKANNNWSESCEIICPLISFVSSSHSILYSKLNARFCDVDQNGCLDPKDVLRNINKKTKAIIYVGLGGSSNNLSEIIEISKKFRLKLILDAAHMAGAKMKDGKKIGLGCDVTIFSFQAVKNLPTSDSGMVCFKNNNDSKLARQLSWCGIDTETFSRNNRSFKINRPWVYEVKNLGYKYNGNSINAIIGSVGLKYLNSDNKRKIEISKIYDDNILQSIKKVKHSKNSSRHLYQILVKDRDKLFAYLKKNNIYCGVHYQSILNYSFYKNNPKVKKSKKLTMGNFFSERVISLPLHNYLSNKDVLKVCNCINKFQLSKN